MGCKATLSENPIAFGNNSPIARICRPCCMPRIVLPRLIGVLNLAWQWFPKCNRSILQQLDIAAASAIPGKCDGPCAFVPCDRCSDAIHPNDLQLHCRAEKQARMLRVDFDGFCGKRCRCQTKCSQKSETCRFRSIHDDRPCAAICEQRVLACLISFCRSTLCGWGRRIASPQRGLRILSMWFRASENPCLAVLALSTARHRLD